MTGNRRVGMVLQERDHHLLSELAVMRVIDREMARVIAGFGVARRANFRLSQLTQAGLLRRFFIGTVAHGRKAVYKTLLTWVKDRMGTGEWLRGQTEHCMLATRGKPVFLHGNHTTVLEAARREHSRKPEEFYALVVATCPGSKVELFCRQRRAGWEVYGNATDLFGIEDSVGPELESSVK